MKIKIKKFDIIAINYTNKLTSYIRDFHIYSDKINIKKIKKLSDKLVYLYPNCSDLTMDFIISAINLILFISEKLAKACFYKKDIFNVFYTSKNRDRYSVQISEDEIIEWEDGYGYKRNK